MEMQRKTFVALLLAVISISVLVGYQLHTSQLLVGHRDPKTHANVFVIFETARGTWTYPAGNVITDIGERYDRNILHFNNVTGHNATQWISLGNSTIVQTNTILDAEATTAGFTRAANDTCVHWMNGTDWAANVTKRFTATATIRVNATAVHWNPTSNSDNNCYAMASITATTFENGDNCTIRWVLTRDNN